MHSFFSMNVLKKCKMKDFFSFFYIHHENYKPVNHKKKMARTTPLCNIYYKLDFEVAIHG